MGVSEVLDSKVVYDPNNSAGTSEVTSDKLGASRTESLKMDESNHGQSSENLEECNYPTEFHKLVDYFVSDLTIFRKKYPLIVAISTIAFFVLGLSYIWTFSLSNILIGTFLLTLSVALTANVIENEPWSFPFEVGRSLQQVREVLTQMYENISKRMNATDSSDVSPSV